MPTPHSSHLVYVIFCFSALSCDFFLVCADVNDLRPAHRAVAKANRKMVFDSFMCVTYSTDIQSLSAVRPKKPKVAQR